MVLKVTEIIYTHIPSHQQIFKTLSSIKRDMPTQDLKEVIFTLVVHDFAFLFFSGNNLQVGIGS